MSISSCCSFSSKHTVFCQRARELLFVSQRTAGTVSTCFFLFLPPPSSPSTCNKAQLPLKPSMLGYCQLQNQPWYHFFGILREQNPFLSKDIEVWGWELVIIYWRKGMMLYDHIYSFVRAKMLPNKADWCIKSINTHQNKDTPLIQRSFQMLHTVKRTGWWTEGSFHLPLRCWIIPMHSRHGQRIERSAEMTHCAICNWVGKSRWKMMQIDIIQFS